MIVELAVTTVCDHLLIRWSGWECAGIGLVFVEAL
jgi:hypothetical protein